MPWEGEERRRRITGDSGQRRRRSDLDEIADALTQTQSDLRETHERLEDAENRIAVLDGIEGKPGLIENVAYMRGQMDYLLEICRRIDGKTGFNWTTFLATVIVPLAGLILTAYLAVRLGAPQALPGGSP